jgi:hypothetical protein
MADGRRARTRAEILQDAGLPERIAPLLEGGTERQLAESAREVAADLGLRPAQTEAVALARRALKHAELLRRATGGGGRS